jgi:hypothetical protein
MKPKTESPFPVMKPPFDKMGEHVNRAVSVVSLALPDGYRLAEIKAFRKSEARRLELAGLFLPARSKSYIFVDKALSHQARVQTLLHELAHALDWGIRGRSNHDLGWGCAYSLVYRVYIGEVTSVRAYGDGRVKYVDEEGQPYEAMAAL